MSGNMKCIEKYSSLSIDAQWVLCFFAYSGLDYWGDMPFHDKSVMAKLSKQFKIDTKIALNELAEKKLVKSYRSWGNVEYNIDKDEIISALLFLFKEHADWGESFKKVVRTANDDFIAVRDSVEYFVRSNKPTLVHGVGRFNKICSLYVPFVDVADLRPLFMVMDDHILNNVIQVAIVESFKDDTPLDYDNISCVINEHKGICKETKELLLSLVALFGYFYDGRCSDSAVDGYNNHLSLQLRAVKLMNASEYGLATPLFLQSLKLRNKISNDKNVYANTLSNFYLLFSYYLNPYEQYRNNLQQLAKKRIALEKYGMGGVAVMASLLLDEHNEMCKRDYGYILENEHLQTNDANLLYLFAKKFDLKTGEMESPKTPLYKIVRHEMSRILDLTDEEKGELEALYGNKPLLSSIHRKELWEVVLECIEKAVAGDEKDGTAIGSKRRIAYIIGQSGRIEVREQNVLKNGSWGAGKRISDIAFCQGDIPFMDDVDRRILADYKSSDNYELQLSNVLPYMVGIQRVFSGRYAPFAPVEVVDELPYLEVKRGKNGFKLASNVTLCDLQDIEGEHIVRKINDVTYTVIRVDKRMVPYYMQLLRLKSIPLEAEQKLKNLLPALGKVMEIHSDMVDYSSIAEVLDGSPKISVLIKNSHPSVYTVNLRVRPFDGGVKSFIPGEGAALVFDEKDGVRYRIKRNLAEEQFNKKMLMDFCDDDMEVLPFRSKEDSNAMFMHTEQVLALMDFVSQNGDVFQIEWENSNGLKLKKTVNPEKWNINMKPVGGWFEMEGDVCLDDSTLLSVAQLIQVLNTCKNERYVRLSGDEFIELTASLRKQLARIEAIASQEHGRVRLSALNAGLLGEDAYDGVFKINREKTLDELRGRIQASRNVKISVPKTLNADLRDYQKEGFEWMARMDSWGAGVCLADDMGLGKTIQSIAYLLHKSKLGVSLVVAPVSVVPNWKKELERFAPSLVVKVVNGAGDRVALIKSAKAGEVVLTSYGMLLTNNEDFMGKKWNVAVLDEAHVIKNRDTKTSVAIMNLQCKSRVILTGTPVQNNLGELWNLFHFINPGLLGGWEEFKRKFVVPIEENQDKERQKQLKRIIQPFMLRRTKSDVLEDLPEKNEILVSVELTEDELAVYELIRTKAEQQLKEGGNKVEVKVLAEIMRLRQAACATSLVEKEWKGDCSKIETFVNMAKTIADGGSRALVFSQFTSFLELVRKKLDEQGIGYLYLDGSTPLKQRELLVNDFQQGNVPIFLISLKAGGLGLNLVGANYVIHLDPWWNPSIEQQATDRAYRIGQQRDVTVYHLVAKNTIEEKILRLHKTKRNLADALLDGSDVGHKLNADDLLAMLEKNSEA